MPKSVLKNVAACPHCGGCILLSIAVVPIDADAGWGPLPDAAAIWGPSSASAVMGMTPWTPTPNTLIRTMAQPVPPFPLGSQPVQSRRQPPVFVPRRAAPPLPSDAWPAPPELIAAEAERTPELIAAEAAAQAGQRSQRTSRAAEPGAGCQPGGAARPARGAARPCGDHDGRSRSPPPRPDSSGIMVSTWTSILHAVTRKELHQD